MSDYEGLQVGDIVVVTDCYYKYYVGKQATIIRLSVNKTSVDLKFTAEVSNWINFPGSIRKLTPLDELL